MPPKTPTRTVTFGDEAREKILKGAETVYQATKSTYSPLSGNVAIENQFNQRTTVSHDGVTVARSITLEDPIENIGARMLVDASMKTNDMAGDGTTATVILAYHILELAKKRIAAGYNPMLMRKGIEKAALAAKEHIDKVSLKVNESQLEDVATVSSGDSELGKLIASTIVDVGVNGGVTVEDYQGIGIESEIVEGFYFSKGYASPYFMTDPDETANLENCQVLIVEDKITAMAQIGELLETVANSDNRKLLIIGNVSGQALGQLVMNKMKGLIEVVTVPPATFGSQTQNHLEDLAILTDAEVVLAGTPASEINTEFLGIANNVVVTRNSTTILVDKQPEVQERIKKLKTGIKKESDQFNKDHLKNRLAMLEGKIGIIRVGGENETIAREKKMRVDDAVHATQAARDSGIVPGGATAFVHTAQELTKSTPVGDRDFQEGYNIVLESLNEPFLQLMANAGMKGEFNLAAVQAAEPGYGFNVLAKSAEVVNLMSEGVVDPTLVVKQVIENGCAAAGLALTNNATITFNDDGDTGSLTNA